MAVIQDPQGAFFMVWQAGQHFGAAVVNEPGALCWNELASPDMDASASFYRDLFGWKIEPFEGSPQPYLTIQNADRGNGGIRNVQDGEPPNWSTYFAVEDVAGAAENVVELGGSKLMEPMDIGVGKIAPVHDPQGAVFALYEGELQP
jgi:predicted enzyme related to lactoylglutathione lyase